MRIPINRESQIPLYQQIEYYLRQSILSGQLAPETRLPPTRQLAQGLGVNRITVESAYAGLEADGLIQSRRGSGSYVMTSPPLPEIPDQKPGAPWPLWQQELQSETAANPGSQPAALLLAAGHPDAINLAGGSGDAQLFPVDEYRKVIQAVLKRDGMDALDYGDLRGYAPLRSTVAHILASQGIPARHENVLITAGSQQAIALVSQLLLKPGDTLMVESPTYAVALDLFRSLNLKLVGVPMDEHGMRVDLLEPLMQQHHPRLIYTIPNFHNPSGASLSAPRRRLLITLADRYNVPILEDDYVGDLRYAGRSLPALKSLDPGGRVIYASTFSKMLMPGLRVGFLVADGPVYDSLVRYKHVSDLTSSNLHQRALEAYVTVGRYQIHLRRTCQLYSRRLNTMVEAIHRYLPAQVSMDVPLGGLFLWLRLPERLSAETLLPLACEEGVAFTPGCRFFPNECTGENYMRLNFASQPPERIREGIHRLGKAMQRLEARR
ncbi:MAG TPA: PLP-dependent aminotransferase family protein [Levilinea sp.]|nr:PLP-dependent aminotransferase family protein [Levilinea sp.]